MKNMLVRAVLVAGLLLSATDAARLHGAAAPAQEAQVSAAEAAPFIGEWTLDLQGPNGPGTFALTVTSDKDKVAAEIASAQMPKQSMTSISLADQNLVLKYSFTWEGTPVDAVVTLMPDKDGKTGAQIDFAGGAYTMTGTASRKEKTK
jgi:hypothetical protein